MVRYMVFRMAQNIRFSGASPQNLDERWTMCSPGYKSKDHRPDRTVVLPLLRVAGDQRTTITAVGT